MHQSSSSSSLQVPSEEFYHFDKKFRFFDDHLCSITSIEQKRVEDLVDECFKAYLDKADIEPLVPTLLREEHATYLWKGLIHLPRSYEGLDASRPWIAYWIVHSLELLAEPFPEEVAQKMVEFLNACKCPTGGYGGGPGQVAHLATTYAAIMALCILGTPEAYQSIDRENLYTFLKRMKQADGSFIMHNDGEVDIRGAYCAAAVSVLTNMVDQQLFDRTAEWVVSCQTYEGGFSSSRGCEAHGGYTYCGVACLLLLGRPQLCDTKSLLKWLAFKQMKYEGGFQGRTNKLVDGCYSFWQAAIFPLLHLVLNCNDGHAKKLHWMYDTTALQNYLLICCQSPNGGLIDKPGKNRDFYHTCYTLSGLSIAQNFISDHNVKTYVVGPKSNLLQPTHPLFNVCLQSESKASEHFKRLPSVKI